MKRPFDKSQFIGFWATSIIGTLLHFVYAWTGKTPILAWLGSVNESTWEHMKLFFWPMLIYGIIQSFSFKDRAGFWYIKFKGIIVGLAALPILFYTYNGAFAPSPKWYNVLTFFIATAIAFIYESRQYKYNDRIVESTSKIGIVGIAVIALMFIIFTYATPQLLMFLDPLTNTYGVQV